MPVNLSKPARLPRLLVIADRFTLPAVKDRVILLSEAGLLTWVQLRDHAATDEEVMRAAEHTVPEIQSRSPGTVISVNGHVKLAARLGIHLHLGYRGPSPKDARRYLNKDAMIGYSAHIDTTEADTEGADYLTYSPVFPVSKPWRTKTVGLDGLAAFCWATDRPVMALGGIKAETAGLCLEAGAHGVAVLSGIMEADDVVAAARQYAAALKKAGPETVSRIPRTSK